ncbi:MAG: hypothetical protein RLZZ555_561 [Pseudomonadota bacterium]|jgi:cytochrome subunit of sulfide dehydrogenase
MRPAISLIVLMAASASAAAQPFDPLQVRGWAAACTGCHSSQGQAEPGMPALAGFGRAAMVAALLDFKSGRRHATVMHQLARGYDDEQLEAIAGYFSRLPPP